MLDDLDDFDDEERTGNQTTGDPGDPASAGPPQDEHHQPPERITRALESLQMTATCPEMFKQMARQTKPIPQELLGIR